MTRLHLEWQQAAADAPGEAVDQIIHGSGELFAKSAMRYIRPKLNRLLDKLEVPRTTLAACPLLPT
ncbi:MAG TPA: hypothetical protein PLY80_09270, partial [Pseudomonadota bacterium]|nr:hypothetical protein [Pseudomonadota bacterium]